MEARKSIVGTRHSIATKIEILHKLKLGESPTDLCKEYGITARSVRNIKYQAEKLDNSEENSVRNTLHQRKNFKKPEHPLLEKILFTWFEQNREAGIPITGAWIGNCAKLIYKELGGAKRFVTSPGWIAKFKQRHGIRQLSIQGEKLAADTESAEVFCRQFPQYIQLCNYDLENIYNADETGINWRSLPRKTSASASEKSYADGKVPKDRVTALVCANAAGTHRLPLLLIGKYAKPRRLTPDLLQSCDIVYKRQKSAGMDKNIFLNWFKNHFIPSVNTRQEKDGKSGKILLLLDNAPSHPHVDELNAVDENVEVKYLPKNTTSLIQPMEQGVIAKIKRSYRRKFLESLYNDEENSLDPEQYIEKFCIRDCCCILQSALEDVTPGNLRAAWKKLLPNHIRFPDKNSEANACDIFMSSNEAIAKLGDFKGYTLSALEEYFDQDKDDPGWRVMEVSQIINDITLMENRDVSECETVAVDNVDKNDDTVRRVNEVSGAIDVIAEFTKKNPNSNPETQAQIDWVLQTLKSSFSEFQGGTNDTLTDNSNNHSSNSISD